MDLTITTSPDVNNELSDMSQSSGSSSSHAQSVRRNDERILGGCSQPTEENKVEEFAYSTSESMKKIPSKLPIFLYHFPYHHLKYYPIFLKVINLILQIPPGLVSLMYLSLFQKTHRLHILLNMILALIIMLWLT